MKRGLSPVILFLILFAVGVIVIGFIGIFSENSLTGKAVGSESVSSGEVSSANSVSVTSSGGGRSRAQRNIEKAISCTDSDGGFNPQVRGIVSGVGANGSSYNYGDYCVSGDTVKEYYCSSSAWVSNNSLCLYLGSNYFCQNGACIKNDSAIADLVVNSLGVSIVNGSGSYNVTLTANVKNVGTFTALASSTLFLIDGNSTIASGSASTPAISPGISVNIVKTLNVNSPSQTTTYVASAIADNLYQVGESNEGNNKKTANFVLSPQNQTGNQTLPDLIVLSVSANVGNQLNSTNYNVTISATVKNNGNDLAVGSFTRLGVDNFGGYNVYTDTLSSGQTRAIVSPGISVSVGNNRVARATADYTNSNAESNENNNVLTSTFNIGNGTTPSINGTLNISSAPSEAVIYDNNVFRGLTPREYNDASPGSHTIRLTKTGYLDYVTNVNVNSGQTTFVNAVLQLNQTNLPDLIITNLTVMNKTFQYSSNSTNGTVINYYFATLTATVRNSGAGTAGASFAVLGVDGVGSANAPQISSLPAGASIIVSRIISNIPQGTGTARATADFYSQVYESNENNNILTTPFTLP